MSWPIPSSAELLAWYACHRRDLPWRPRPGARRDPYRIWLAEVMLQQTTVAAVLPRYHRFLQRFPDLEALAAAPWEAVAAEWAGLGYYARARHLHAAARQIKAEGGFPRTVDGLAALPGIGRYTAAAIAAIAFDVPVVPVDANVARIVVRVVALAQPPRAIWTRIEALAQGLMADPAARARPGDVAQALFDLGATLCTPRRPNCGLCPWREACAGHRAGIAADLPRRDAASPRPRRYGVHFLLLDGAGRILLRRRPPHGLLGGMPELPGTPWRAAPWEEAEALAYAPIAAPWRRVAQTAHHSFTHFELEMALYYAQQPEAAGVEGEWHDPATAGAMLPGAMRRLLALVTDIAA